MPNSFFRFKQFIIHQEYCAMKVCTDACLFGAWIADKLKAEEQDIEKLLDIGTGTGLLSLMLAQKLDDIIIDAVEIDEAAAQQAKDNFQASVWHKRLNVYHSSLQQYTKNILYDCIVSNPPFYENDLKSDDAKRNIALHSSDLSLENLLQQIQKLLTPDGSFFILLPYHRSQFFESIAIKNDFHLEEKVLVKQTSKHNFFRSMLHFNRKKTEAKQSEIIIQSDGIYTQQSIDLLKDYYLYL